MNLYRRPVRMVARCFVLASLLLGVLLLLDCGQSRFHGSIARLARLSSRAALPRPQAESVPRLAANEQPHLAAAVRRLHDDNESELSMDHIAVNLTASSSACAGAWQNCHDVRCCQGQDFKCYQKDEWFAQCRPSCDPAHEPWTCTPLKGRTHTPPRPSQEQRYRPLDERLLRASRAEKHIFYMYRVQGDGDYQPENQNMANLAGAMWYLHNEIVNNRYERRFKKTRIQRFKVTTQATQPMVDDGLDWGIRFAFDLGQCTGPWQCADAFEKYGHFVGCNRADHFPTQQWHGKIFYPNAVWYSLPGKCSSKKHNEHTTECEIEQPGGACDEVTGRGDCTYSYVPAGEISIDELEGIADFQEFVRAGGWEYNNHTDRGVHMTFWDSKYDAAACQKRLEHAHQLFRNKFQGEIFQENLPEPACNFDFGRFYSRVPRHR